MRQADPDRLVFESERVLKLQDLTSHPSWHELELVLEDRRQKHMRDLTREMMRGRPISEELQLRHAGFWEGVKAVLQAPHAVEKRLQKMLETAESAQQEGET
jgi:hypothetical protein